MTNLSININKIALLRNSRGRNFPSVESFAEKCLRLGAHGITLHPRPDQRHARYSDVLSLKQLCQSYDRELNVEGFPSQQFIDVVICTQPSQCTLVPDNPAQLTSDHGWDVRKEQLHLQNVIKQIKAAQVRVSLFIDFDSPDIELAQQLGADRIELYTEPYACAFDSIASQAILSQFHKAALTAHELGLGVNAGHDLNLQNLETFLHIPGILEVSIGHAFVVECIEFGIEAVMRRYLTIVGR